MKLSRRAILLIGTVLLLAFASVGVVAMAAENAPGPGTKSTATEQQEVGDKQDEAGDKQDEAGDKQDEAGDKQEQAGDKLGEQGDHQGDHQEPGDPAGSD